LLNLQMLTNLALLAIFITHIWTFSKKIWIWVTKPCQKRGERCITL